MRFLLIPLFAAAAFAAGDDLTPAQIDDIIKKFAAKEAEFAKAREVYTYHQTARIQELDSGGNVTGRWEEISDIVFERGGKRTERVVRAPVPTLKQIVLTPEDLKDMRDVQPFVLTTEHIPDYHIRYLGKETLDEIPCYAFAVKPKQLKPGERYFSGIVWVDDRDLQVVKTYGRATGIVKEGNVFPKFETFREQIDGVYWFPTYTIAEDTLHFRDYDARIRQTIKYEDYKRFGAESTIIFDDVVDGPAPPPPPPAPAK